jgi:hypothetical protein
MHGNLENHPDLPGIVKGLDALAKKHDRNSFIAGLLITGGSTAFSLGVIMLKFQKIGILK